MSATILDLHLPQINFVKSRSAKERTGEPVHNRPKSFFPADYMNSQRKLRKLDAATTIPTTIRTRPLGCLPYMKKVKAWKGLGLLTKEEFPNLPNKVRTPPACSLHSEMSHTPAVAAQNIVYHPKASSPQMGYRLSVLKTSIVENSHTDDEEYLDMISRINMNQYKDDKRPLTNEFGKYNSPVPTKRQYLKSARLKHSSKPLQDEITTLEYIKFAEQSQLSTRLRSFDVRNSSEYEPCQRCLLRGTRCTHCIAIRTGGGYIILDTSVPANYDQLERLRKQGWEYKRENTDEMNAILTHDNKPSQNGITNFSSNLQLAYDMPEDITSMKYGNQSLTSNRIREVNGQNWFMGDGEQNYVKVNSGNYKHHTLDDSNHDDDAFERRNTSYSKSKPSNTKDMHGEYRSSGSSFTEIDHQEEQKHDNKELSQATSIFDESGHTKKGSTNDEVFHSQQQTNVLSGEGGFRPRSSVHNGNASPEFGGRRKYADGRERVNMKVQKQRKKNSSSENEAESDTDDEKERKKREKLAKFMISHENGACQKKVHQKVISGKYEREKEEKQKDHSFGDLMRFKSKRDNIKVKDCSLQDLQGIDPLDYLAKYCIIDQKKVPHYKQVFENVDRDEDNLVTIPELDFALKAVNYNLISDNEMQYVHNILELAGRYALNFQLFCLVAALSEKVVALDDMVKRLMNNMDFEALETKMKKCKELFYLLANDKEGLVTTRDLSVELQAGGLTKEHVDFVTDRLNYDGRGIIQFLDYLTYVPLFIEIHDNINNNPLDFTRTK